jgi:putative membrane protein
MNMYEGYHFIGMHFFWWFVWVSIIIWIFAVPYNIPGQRYKRDSSLDILKKRLASGEINNTEYQEMKSVLDIV